ncbi:MAG: hypothetical protein JST87_17625 [Bacteroidetes bacterium]|nr:hypothetical protein [Bacteroidota bacterium]MBS1934796.1 hypothetical protein [Bacteroidota bacterium]
MKKNEMYFNTHTAKIYKQSYRPSTNLYHFLKTLLCVILSGRSPMAKVSYHERKHK